MTIDLPADNSDLFRQRRRVYTPVPAACVIAGRTASLILLIFFALILGGCLHKPPRVAAPIPKPPSAPKPSNLDIGESHFQAGEYAEAALAYEAYLSDNPNGPMSDRALFNLALSYAWEDEGDSGYWKAHKILTTLYTQHPKSPYKPQAKYILSIQEEIQKMKVDLQEKDRLLQEKTEPPQEKVVPSEDADKDARQKDRALLRQKDKALQEKEKELQDIKDAYQKLSDELERMKKIDLQRRPSRPPG